MVFINVFIWILKAHMMTRDESQRKSMSLSAKVFRECGRELRVSKLFKNKRDYDNH